MAVSVIISARDASATLPWTLDALSAQRLAEPYEVIVVDNGSRDATATIARAAGARVVTGPGRGPGPARNAGVAAARYRCLAFTDADCAPEPDWLAEGLAALRAGAALAQGWVGPPGDVVVGPWDRTLHVRAAVGLFETANLFLTREAFTVAGGFGDGIEAPGAAPFGEDVLLGWAIARAGLPTAFVPEARVRHWVFPRSLRGYLRERRRRELFPRLVAEVPELRESLLWHGAFLHRRDALLLAALLGGLAGTLTGRHAPTLAAAPWLVEVTGDARRIGVRLAAGRVLADAVSLGCAARGSLRARTLVL